MEESEHVTDGAPPPPPEEKRRGVSFAVVEEKPEESTQAEVRKGPEPYRYEPEERGETWDIYKQKSVMENVSKRKSEDAVLIKAKADAALRAAAVAEAASKATSDFAQEASDGRKTRGRTAIVAPGGNLCPTEEELNSIGNATEEVEEDEEDEEDDDAANSKVVGSGGEVAPNDAAGAQESELSKLSSTEPSCSAEGYSVDAAPAAPAPAAQAPAPAPSASEPVPAPPKAPAADTVGGTRQTFPLEVLQNGCPPDVPPGRKEDHLSDADFEAALKMSREEFEKLPQWKRTNAKKAAKIF